MSDDVLFAEVIEPSKELQVTYKPATITDNIASLEAFVDDQLELYVGTKIDYTDAKSVTMGRNAAADLNKLKEPIERERKRIKREYEAPLKAFETRIKAITSKIDDARSEITKQVKEADALFAENRKEVLRQSYEDVAGDLASLIPLEALIESKWLTRSCKEPSAINALAKKAAKALADYKTLDAMTLRHKDEVLRHFCQTLDIAASLQVEEELTIRDEELADFIAAQAEVMGKPEQEPIKEQNPTAEAMAEPASPQEEPTQEPIFEWHLETTFIGTRGLAQSVGQALKGAGITGKITCKGAIND